MPPTIADRAAHRRFARLARDACRIGATRGEQIEQRYGYDKFPGNCHVVPNHALVVLALLYADGDFAQAMTIVNTSGWDTDCNSGNVGCLFGIMLGLKGLEGGRDWRGPIADRTLISSADGGYAINDAASLAYDFANCGLRLAGRAPLAAAKGGRAISFRSERQRARVLRRRPNAGSADRLSLAQGTSAGGPGPGADASSVWARARGVAALTPTFAPQNVVAMRTYDLQAAPRVYPGQRLEARVLADAAKQRAGRLRSCALRAYGAGRCACRVRRSSRRPCPRAAKAELEWIVPDLDGQPIESVGVALALRRRAGRRSRLARSSGLGRRAVGDVQAPERRRAVFGGGPG